MMHPPGIWNVLSEAQIERMRSAAFAFIEDTGFVIQHPALLDKARMAGARVDEAGGRIRMDRTLACELMAQAPERYAIRNILGREWEVGGAAQSGRTEHSTRRHRGADRLRCAARRRGDRLGRVAG